MGEVPLLKTRAHLSKFGLHLRLKEEARVEVVVSRRVQQVRVGA